MTCKVSDGTTPRPLALTAYDVLRAVNSHDDLVKALESLSLKAARAALLKAGWKP